jgi:GAF domain-containing protein
MIDTTPPSIDTEITEPSVSVAAARIVRRLREAQDWRLELDWLLKLLATALDSHRTILFRLETLPEGFAQSVVGFWADKTIAGEVRPTIIPESVIHEDAFMQRLAREGRQGKMFAGRTSEIEGFLRRDFDRQKIKSFMSATIFVYGQVYGTIAVNDCVRERHWTHDEKAACEIVAAAIADAIERSQSDAHFSDTIRSAFLQASTRQERSSSSTRPPKRCSAIRAPRSSARTCWRRSFRRITARVTPTAASICEAAARR